MEGGAANPTVPRTATGANSNSNSNQAMMRDGCSSSNSKKRLRPPSVGRRLRRRRYLVVPSSEGGLDAMGNAYSLSDGDDDAGHGGEDAATGETATDGDVWRQACLLQATSSRRYRRPLPAVQVLASAAAKGVSFDPTRSPLMTRFYASIGVDPPARMAAATAAEAGAAADADDNRGLAAGAEAEADDDDIFNPSLSTLTVGQHRRYLQLTDAQGQTERRTEAQRRELKALTQHVVQEQAAYGTSLDRFHDTHRARYRIGFGTPAPHISSPATAAAAAFCRWACSHAADVNVQWRRGCCLAAGTDAAHDDDDDDGAGGIPMRYGRTRQILSMHSRYSSSASSSSSRLDVEDLMCTVVHDGTPAPAEPPPNRPVGAYYPDVGSTIRPPQPEAVPPVVLLRNDATALELAARYSASIVTTSETLETLLRRPGDHSSRWILTARTVPLASAAVADAGAPAAASAILLDMPIAQAYPTPRACLERGLQEGLYQAWSSATEDGRVGCGTDGKETAAAVPGGYTYSIWTLPNLPNVHSNKKRVKVLIRTPVRAFDPATGRPIRLRAHVEYFWTGRDDGTGDTGASEGSGAPRFGKEIPNSYEAALWILDQVLLGNQASGQYYRVDPDSCTVVGRDSVGIAHAFALSSSGTGRRRRDGGPSNNPLDHWETLIQLLHALSTIDVPESLLCLPGRITLAGTAGGTGAFAGDDTNDASSGTMRLDPLSVSVHAPTAAAAANAAINLEAAMEQAGAVVLNDGALRDCRREWEWNRPEQIPNTFPIDPRRDTKSGER